MSPSEVALLDMLRNASTMLKDLLAGYRRRELHMPPDALLAQIDAAAGVDEDDGE